MTKESVKSSKEMQQTCLLDLNENIFHEIFQYLPYADLYLYVRSASKILRSFVEGYIQLNGSFIFISTNKWSFHKRCLSVLQRNGKIVSYLPGLRHTIPKPSSAFPIGSYYTFCEAINGKLIFGQVDLTKVYQPGKVAFGSRNSRKEDAYPNEYHIYTRMFECNDCNKNWRLMTSSDPQPQRNYIGTNSSRISNLNCCVVDDNLFIAITIRIHASGESVISSFDNKLLWIPFLESSTETRVGKKYTSISKMKYSIKVFDLYDHCQDLAVPWCSRNIVQINWMVVAGTSNEIILVGSPEYKIDCSRVWRGKMNKECSNILWTLIKVSLPHMDLKSRNLSLSIFELRNNIYFLENMKQESIFSSNEQDMMSCYVGGRLNIQEEKYHRYEYWAPTSIKHILSATADKNKIFAVILCAVNEERIESREQASVNRLSEQMRLVYFDEESGFIHTMNNKQLQWPFNSLKNDSECSFDKLIRIK